MKTCEVWSVRKAKHFTALYPWLSWLEHSTFNRDIVGSNPIGYTLSIYSNFILDLTVNQIPKKCLDINGVSPNWEGSGL